MKILCFLILRGKKIFALGNYGVGGGDWHYSLTLFVSMSNLFLKSIYIYMSHNNFIRIVVSHLCDSSCILLSFSLLPSTFAFSFAEELGMFIEFVEVENSRPFLYFMVFLFKLCDKAWNASNFQILGYLSLDLQKLLIYEWLSFSFC